MQVDTNSEVENGKGLLLTLGPDLTREAALELPMPRDARLRGLCQALLDAPGDQRPLAAWAKTVNASGRTLARRFQSETGLSFGAWRQQARVLEAMGRLGSGAPVTQVALDLGYESVSAFSAMFRRAAGASPSYYRNRPQTG